MWNVWNYMKIIINVSNYKQVYSVTVKNYYSQYNHQTKKCILATTKLKSSCDIVPHEK